jgi:hypothetical protein
MRSIWGEKIMHSIAYRNEVNKEQLFDALYKLAWFVHLIVLTISCQIFRLVW